MLLSSLYQWRLAASISLFPVEAYGVIRDSVMHWGDGVVEAGSGLVFNWLGPHGLSIHTWNLNGQRQTWKILGEALLAVYDHMHQHQFGAAELSTMMEAERSGEEPLDKYPLTLRMASSRPKSRPKSRDLEPDKSLHRRTTNINRWPCIGTHTAVSVTFIRAVGGSIIPSLLADALGDIEERIRRTGTGDAVIAQGLGVAVNWYGLQGLGLRTWSDANHRLTWSILGQALVALSLGMVDSQFGEAVFTIWENREVVGYGKIGPATWRVGN